MKIYIPNRHDDQEARKRAEQQRQLVRERTNGHPRRPWQWKAMAGVVIGLLGYLITSCYFAERLDKPKIERDRFRFTHQP